MWWVFAALLVAVVGAIYWRRAPLRPGRPTSPPDLAPDGMYLATSSQSKERVHRVLPSNGSEDRRDLLRAPDVPESSTEERNDYRPNSATDWVVDLTFADGVTVSKQKLLEILDRAWLKTVGNPMVRPSRRPPMIAPSAS